MNNIKCFKLKRSGEEFIAQLESNDYGETFIIDPVVLTSGMDGKFALVPFYAISADRKLEINESDCLFFGEEVIPPVKDQYVKEFGLIQTPEKNIII